MSTPTPTPPMPPTAPPAPRRAKRRTGLGLYLDKKTGGYLLDVVVHGHRLRKRYGVVPFQVAKQLAQRDALALRVSVLTTGGPPAAPAITDLTLGAALTRFERDAFPTLRPRTRRLYLALMKPLREHLGAGLRLSALSPLDVERYKRLRTASAPGRRTPGTTICNRELALLSAVLERCKTWGLLRRADNPVAAVTRFKESRGRERTLSDAEEARLLAALREPDRTVVQLALECGARLVSELLPVTWADVALDKARLTITATHAKNGRARHVPLSPDMVQRLRTMQATSTSPFVFPATQGGFHHRFKARSSRRCGRWGSPA